LGCSSFSYVLLVEKFELAQPASFSQYCSHCRYFRVVDAVHDDGVDLARESPSEIPAVALV
jgi:hypothetical protein